MSISQNLGFSESAKLLIIHADDAGLSHSQNSAIIQCLQKGIVNSYSIMVPCPWFYEMAMFAKDNPEYDCGIHLTLTCEWENYKFGPVLPIAEVPSLVDKNGHFFKSRKELENNASCEELKKELKAQIDRAYQLGLTPTHIDSHMYSLGARPEFFNIYRDLGVEYDLPVLINKEVMEMVGLPFEKNIKEGDLFIDKAHYATMDYYKSGKLEEYYNSALDNLVSGLNILLIHPAFDNSEMKGITVNHPNFGAEWRQQDFDYFTDDRVKEILQESDIQLVAWKQIKSALNVPNK